MAVIGNRAAANDISVFKTISKQTITGTGATSYALDLGVSGPNDLEVFVNNVRQEPSVAYNVGSGLITFTEAVDSTDDCYLIYQGGRVGTVTHPSDQPLEATTGTFSGAVSGTNGTFTGNVGIGTSSPIRKLTVSQAGTAEFVLQDTTRAVDGRNFRIFYDNGGLALGTLNDAGTAGAERLRIDSAGRVTMPYQPCCSVYHSGDIAYNGSFGPIVFNSARFNVGNHFNTATGTFTAPVAGKYLVTAYIHWMNDGAYTFQFLRLQVASTNVGIELMRQGTKGGYDVFGGTHIVSVSANDAISVVMGSAGIDAGYSRGGADFNTFEVYLLG